MIPAKYQALAWFIALVLWTGGVGYGGWMLRGNFSLHEQAKETLAAAERNRESDGVLGAIAGDLIGELHEIAVNQPYIAVVPGVCEPTGADAPRDAVVRSEPAAGQPAGPTDAEIGAAIKSDADHYPECFARLRKLQQAVIATGGATP